eukprot:TRINITY_DN10322_c0_g1_i1.p4 TRINITY_DN10322_c0_g1~~TRINITY_DN10322_c0_g1_i1.p4  ORF type:complete len:156 (-),score=7.10 TRINITY_DN10322_c0_g1_i1:978-1445(-)
MDAKTRSHFSVFGVHHVYHIDLPRVSERCAWISSAMSRQQVVVDKQRKVFQLPSHAQAIGEGLHALIAIPEHAQCHRSARTPPLKVLAVVAPSHNPKTPSMIPRIMVGGRKGRDMCLSVFCLGVQYAASAIPVKQATTRHVTPTNTAGGLTGSCC